MSSHTHTRRIARPHVSTRNLRHGARVVAVVNASDTIIEILGHGTFHQTAPSADATHRVAAALEAVDSRVQIDFQPMLDTICQHMSPARAHETRSRFHSRQHKHQSRTAMERARDLASNMRGSQTVQLDSGEAVSAERCWLVPAEDFSIYSKGCRVKVVALGQ